MYQDVRSAKVKITIVYHSFHCDPVDGRAQKRNSASDENIGYCDVLGYLYY
jgi:hypothetical protein